MPRTLASLKTDLGAIVHATNLDNVTAPTDLFNRAARDVMLDIDPIETKRVGDLVVYQDVYDYAAPTDLKENKIIDIRPQVDRGIGENFSQVYGEEFDIRKSDRTFIVTYDGGTKHLRIAADVGSNVTIDSVSGLTTNGTWAASNDATNLTADTGNAISGGTSLNFDVDGLGVTATLTNSTMTQVDLSDHDEQSSIFFWMYFPSASAVTNVNLRWGNDAAAYWNRTVTAPHFGSFQDGWNLLRFDWNGATEVGAVDPAAIDYLVVTLTYDGNADTDFRVDDFVSRLGENHEVVYYSRFMFQDSTGTLIEETTADTDLCNLEQSTVNLVLYRAAELASQQIQGSDASFDLTYFRQEYRRFLRAYKNQFKSEWEKPKASYYRMR